MAFITPRRDKLPKFKALLKQFNCRNLGFKFAYLANELLIVFEIRTKLHFRSSCLFLFLIWASKKERVKIQILN
jgi:hypothetical protein